jgi:quercetin dioxygenase-like cupin family protein
MKNSYWLFGARLSVLASHDDTGGHYDLVEGWFPSGCQTPLHRHTRYAEQIYVLEGEFTVWAGGRQAVLRPGDHIIIPVGTPHAAEETTISLLEPSRRSPATLLKLSRAAKRNDLNPEMIASI